MDPNKLIVLQDVDYTIRKHCGICKHADLSSDGWGYCNIHSYIHQKHNIGESRLSITSAGVCLEDFEANEEVVAAFGSFSIFVEE